MTKITKCYEIDFGHRVWTQVKDDVLSCGATTKCKRMHGHRGKIILELSGSVDKTGMIIDFTHLGFIKKWIDKVLDHRFLIDINDPLIKNKVINITIDSNTSIIHNGDLFNYDYRFTELEKNTSIEDIYSIVSNTILENLNKKMICIDNDNMTNYIDEWITSFVITNFVPTAENITECLYESISRCLPSNINLESIVFYETPTGSAYYSL